MNIDQSIFKAYDIRGIYPDQINAEIVYKIAQAYAKFINPKTVVVGCDMRLSGEEFKKAIIEGLTDAGVNVIDIGLVSTDTLYFATVFLNVDGGLMATASHNPKEFGGMKMVKEQGRPISSDNGIFEIRDLVVQGIEVKSDVKGSVKQQDVTAEYIAHVLKSFDISAMKPLKVVANPNFGMASVALKNLEKFLPIQFVEILNGNLDGNFPKGRPDPLVPENRTEIIEKIKELKPDLGVSWDADADRAFFFDENGEFVTPAFTSALFTEYYLEKNPGSKILHDTRIVRVIDYVAEKHGGTTVMNKAGHSFIKDRMRKENVVFGCETSGHYYFRDNFYLDNGIIPFLAMLEIISEAKKPLSQILAPLREKFFVSEEINLKFDNENLLEDIKKQYQDATIDTVDGFDFNYPDWRFNVRKSNTENLVRVNVEANSKNLLDEKIKEVVKFVESVK